MRNGGFALLGIWDIYTKLYATVLFIQPMKNYGANLVRYEDVARRTVVYIA